MDVGPARATRLAVRRLGVSVRFPRECRRRTGPRAPFVLKVGRGNLTAFERVRKLHGMRVAQWLMTRPPSYHHNLPPPPRNGEVARFQQKIVCNRAQAAV
jgi:hypothetical protein